MIDNPKSGMSLIVKTITRLTIGLILVFGIYIVLHGHLSPGGGFAGGVIIALSFVHGKDVTATKISLRLAANLESVGALMFLAIALIGLLGGSFFLNILRKGRPFELFSAGTIPLSNIAIGLKVGVGLLAIFLALVILEGAEKEK
jgi:multicomponent Na+:H+ antiporter subunit B